MHTLCKKQADVGATAADNMAALHFASQKGHIQVARYLLAAGASINACTRKGVTPLHYAVQNGHLDLAKLLVKKGANLNMQNKAGKKVIDLAKDDEFRSELLAAEKEKHGDKVTDKKSKAKDGILHANVAIEKKDDLPQEDPVKRDESPPRKKGKVQLPHLGADFESREENAEAN